MTRKTLEALIKTVRDGFGQNCATLFAQIERTLARRQHRKRSRQRPEFTLWRVGRKASSVMPEAISSLPNGCTMNCSRTKKNCLAFTSPAIRSRRSRQFWKVLPREHQSTDGVAQPHAHAHRRFDRRGATRRLEEEGKPYSMITLEDLNGSVGAGDERELRQVPAVARIEQGHHGHRRGTPARIAQRFFREIFPPEDAPKKFTKRVTFHLHTAHLQPESPTRCAISSRVIPASAN